MCTFGSKDIHVIKQLFHVEKRTKPVVLEEPLSPASGRRERAGQIEEVWRMIQVQCSCVTQKSLQIAVVVYSQRGCRSNRRMSHNSIFRHKAVCLSQSRSKREDQNCAQELVLANALGWTRHVRIFDTLTTVTFVHELAGDKPYFFGSKPTELDCAVFGTLGQIRFQMENSTFEDMLNSKLAEIVIFVFLIRAKVSDSKYNVIWCSSIVRCVTNIALTEELFYRQISQTCCLGWPTEVGILARLGRVSHPWRHGETKEMKQLRHSSNFVKCFGCTENKGRGDAETRSFESQRTPLFDASWFCCSSLLGRDSNWSGENVARFPESEIWQARTAWKGSWCCSTVNCELEKKCTLISGDFLQTRPVRFHTTCPNRQIGDTDTRTNLVTYHCPLSLKCKFVRTEKGEVKSELSWNLNPVWMKGGRFQTAQARSTEQKGYFSDTRIKTGCLETSSNFQKTICPEIILRKIGTRPDFCQILVFLWRILCLRVILTFVEILDLNLVRLLMSILFVVLVRVGKSAEMFLRSPKIAQ